ncbi:rhomboid family intramembrane serine protease [Agrobacterium vitis]|uniref:Rhomboid family intramembrane serine protease n=1 Tax=Agrobacterium vitis TaxID=373 RepID=A0ABD6G6Z0_AGRVI|nr:rhomboid family intramembrane serine protease [Agrobacterium vitis]MUO77971.1 rhomboid family intramembrane serine protease [Agrobacterium vitis]MUO96667.1 rhomboid family intramembrane serine protease [Agrobacterium vitis]MUP04840.1 rhomboid family intramembrane serine protease [Agrobacterium vitis]MUZ80721.1 rhomboid family intramembrane serine protease [Agrobacterium vitis]MVA09143.1 rhomboid family intramembrane serine protease [Agrobacterium vitis]
MDEIVPVSSSKQNSTSCKIPVATLILCAVFLIVFRLQTEWAFSPQDKAGFDLQTLVAFGAASRNLVFSGDWFRLLSANFITDSVTQLLLNLPFLIFAGMSLERHFGSICFLAIFFGGCIVGTSFSVLFGNPGIIHFGPIGGLTAILIARSISVPQTPSSPSRGKLYRQAASRGRLFLTIGLPIIYFKTNPASYFGNIMGGVCIGVACGIILRCKWDIKYAARVRKAASALVFANAAMAAYAIYAVNAGFGDYGYLHSMAPAQETRRLIADAQKGGTLYIKSYPLDPIGYALIADHALGEHDYPAAEKYARKGLYIVQQINRPELQSTKMVMLAELALSLRGENKMDDAKEQARMPCSRWTKIGRTLRKDSLCG